MAARGARQQGEPAGAEPQLLFFCCRSQIFAISFALTLVTALVPKFFGRRCPNAAPRCGACSKRTGKPCQGVGHAERTLQASWWQEHGAAHAGGPSAQQAGKLETRALFAGSQGGAVAPAGGNTCGPLSAQLDLKAPAVPRPDTDHTGPSISPASMPNGKVARASARRRF